MRPCLCKCLACRVAAPHTNSRQAAICCFVAGQVPPPPRTTADPLGEDVAVIPIGFPSADVDAAFERASGALAPQLSARAHRLAKQHSTMLVQLLSTSRGRAEAVANRLASSREIACGERIECSGEGGSELEALLVARLGLLQCGGALLRVGDERRRRRELEEAAHALGAAAHALGEECTAVVPSSPKGGLFERQAFAMWARALQLVGELQGERAAEGAVNSVYALAVRRGVWEERLQRPVDLLQRGLRRQPFWPVSAVPAARALERAYDDIVAELRRLMSHIEPPATPDAEGADGVDDAADGGAREGVFASYRSAVVSRGSWSDFQLFASCRKDAAHCERCPLTAAALTAAPALNTMAFGSHFFSRLAPGTHLAGTRTAPACRATSACASTHALQRARDSPSRV